MFPPKGALNERQNNDFHNCQDFDPTLVLPGFLKNNLSDTSHYDHSIGRISMRVLTGGHPNPTHGSKEILE